MSWLDLGAKGAALLGTFMIVYWVGKYIFKPVLAKVIGVFDVAKTDFDKFEERFKKIGGHPAPLPSAATNTGSKSTTGPPVSTTASRASTGPPAT